jgi:heme exporter protein A
MPSLFDMTLIAQNVSCERNGRLVFSNVSFELKPGECLELRGANGAGKSSLLRLVAGLVPKASGELDLNGAHDVAQNLHFIAHQDAMKTAMSVAENLNFWCHVLEGQSIDAALNAFRLEGLKDEPVQLLSAGQRRRLTLSRLFLAKRPLWLLDEPMTALDVASQDILRNHLNAHLQSGGMVMVATHGDLGFAPHHTLVLDAA